MVEMHELQRRHSKRTDMLPKADALDRDSSDIDAVGAAGQQTPTRQEQQTSRLRRDKSSKPADSDEAGEASQ